MKTIKDIADEFTARYENEEFSGGEMEMVRAAIKGALEAYVSQDPEDDEDDLEEEADLVEEEAMAMTFRLMMGPWQDLTPEQRLEWRMRARRKLGL